MKKIVATALALSTILGCAGCAKIGEGDTGLPVETYDADEEGEVYEVGDVLTTASGEFCVNQAYSFQIDEAAVTQLSEQWGDDVSEGQYIVIDASYTNLLTEDVEVSSETFEVYLDNDQIFSPDWEDYFGSYILEGQMFQERTLHPGRTERGFIIYRYYRNADEFEVVCDGVSVKADTTSIRLIPLPTPTPIPVPTEIIETTETTAAPVETTAAPVETQPAEVPAEPAPEETQPAEVPAEPVPEETQPAETAAQ